MQGREADRDRDQIALLQIDIAWEDVAENHRRAARLLGEAAAGGARLAILPEMFSTGFSMDAQRIAQPPGGPSEAFLRAQANDAGPLDPREHPRRRASPRPRNMALLVSPAGDGHALREDPPVLLRRRAQALRGRRPRRDRRRRGRARDAVRLLRPAVPRALPRSRRPRRTSSPSSPTGRTSAASTGARSCAPAPSRTRPTSPASTASATGPPPLLRRLRRHLPARGDARRGRRPGAGPLLRHRTRGGPEAPRDASRPSSDRRPEAYKR